ncbi:MAG: hypothetical protein ACI8RZ_000924 [Myxococcota bacterium]|jgi:hypothetical protein
MRSGDGIYELLTHADDAVVNQGVELARSLSGRQRLAVIARLLQRDDPWLCFAIATTDPAPHTRLFIVWCARSVLSFCGAEDRAVLEEIIASVEAEPRVVRDDGLRWGAIEASGIAARTAERAARAEADANAEVVRAGILARSRDPQVAENLYAETQKDSQLRVESASEEVRLLQRTELYQQCEALLC